MKIRNDWKYKNDLTAFDIAEMIQEYEREVDKKIEAMQRSIDELQNLLCDSYLELEAANKRISEFESE